MAKLKKEVKNSKSESGTMNKKARHWAVIVYPESAPKNWKEIVQKTGCACAVSPLHDCDSNESTGEIKKAHWHLIISYPNTTTYSNVLALTKELKSPIPMAINSVKGAVRYFTHKDNPEKHQYSEADIDVINGFDVEEYNKITATQKYEIMHEIIMYVKERNEVCYIDLLADLYELNFDWYKVAVDNTTTVSQLCTSQWKKNKGRNNY